VNIAKFIQAVKTGDIAQVRIMLAARPELVNMDVSGGNEHRGIHYPGFLRVCSHLGYEFGGD